MIDFLTSPIADTAAARPALLWILGITLASIGIVLLRDAWRWFIALGQTAAEPIDSADVADDSDNSVAAEGQMAAATPPAFERRHPGNAPNGFGRRRTDGIGMTATTA